MWSSVDDACVARRARRQVPHRGCRARRAVRRKNSLARRRRCSVCGQSSVTLPWRIFSTDRTENRSCIHPLMNAAVCRRHARRARRQVPHRGCRARRDGAAEKSPSASSSLQRTRAIAWQGDRRVIAGHLATAHFFSRSY